MWMSVKELVDTLLDFSGEKIINYCDGELKKGTQPYDIFNNLSKGLDEIGRKYENARALDLLRARLTVPQVVYESLVCPFMTLRRRELIAALSDQGKN